MAIDAQVLNLIREQDKRQSNYRQVSRDYMRDTNRSINSLDSNVRYSIEQTNALRSGLGDITGKILSQIKSSSKETIDQATKGAQGTDKALKADNATIVQKLESIRGLMESQRDIVRNYINGIKKTNSYEDETNKNLDRRKMGLAGSGAAGAAGAAAAASGGDSSSSSSWWKNPLIWGAALAGEPIFRAINAVRGANALNTRFRGPQAKLNQAQRTFDKNQKKLDKENARRGNAHKNVNKNQQALNEKRARSNRSQAKLNQSRARLDSLTKTADQSKDAADAARVARQQAIVNQRAAAAAADAKKTSNAAKALKKSEDALKASQKTTQLAKAALGQSDEVLKAATTAASKSAAQGGRLATVLGAGKAVGKGLGAAAGVVGLGMEVYEAGKILTMDPEERKAMLAAEQEEFMKKGQLNRLWYSFTNQSKTIAMATQEAANAYNVAKDIPALWAAEKEKQKVLNDKLAAKAAENTVEARQQKLDEMGQLAELNFADFESSGALQSFLSSAEGRKYFEQVALEKGISKKDARAEIMEQYNSFAAEEQAQQEKMQEVIQPGGSLEGAIEKNTQIFETLAEDLRVFLANASNNVVMSSSTNITTPGVDYGDRQRQMIAG